jgi:polysaccharide biosynthesis protein PslH
MTRRRVLWVSHLVPYPPVAGVLLRAYNLIKAVAARHDLSLVAFVQNPWLDQCFESRAKGLEECGAVLGKFCRDVEFLAIESMDRPAGQMRTAIEGLISPASYMQRWLQGPEAHRAMSRLAARGDFEVAHFDTIALAPYRRHFAGIPATLGHHNVESHMLLRRAENTGNWLKKAYFWQEGVRLRRFEQRVGSQFAQHIVCSDLDGERLRDSGTFSGASTIANGVDCEFFKPSGVPERPQSLIFVGTMNWYPNVDAVLFLLQQLWLPLRARLPALTLDIVGASPPESVRAAARDLPGVKVHGFVKDVRPMVESASLFVCPIRDGGGTKLKILDAFAMQKCVVAHPIACEGIAVSPGHDVEFAVEPTEWVDRIAALLANPGLRAQRGAAARELVVAQYSFDAIGARLADLLDQVAARGEAIPSASR